MIQDYLYLWWKEKLSTIPEIKNVEWDYEQDADNKTDGENSLIQTPAVLISFPGDTDTFDLGNGNQEMDMEVMLRLITVNYRWKDDRIRKVGKVNHYDIARILYKEINKIKYGCLSEIPEFAALDDTPDDQTMITTINRSRIGTDPRHSVYIRSTQSFIMRVEDFTANRSFENVVASLGINLLELLP